MTTRRIKERLINALLRPARFKLGPFEFNGPALLIYPVELILLMAIIAIIVIAVERPELIVDIIGAITG
jgi:hypothetical protein